MKFKNQNAKIKIVELQQFLILHFNF